MPGLTQTQVLEEIKSPLLDSRFSILKQSLVRPEKKQKVIESFKRLRDVLEQETAFIAKHGPSMVPEIDFQDIHNNGGELPKGFAELVRDRGCVIFRNVVPEEQASAWEAELKDYTQRHRSVGGFPTDNPQNWSLWWTRPQVEIRSHERVLEAMSAISKLWHVADPTATVDLGSQVAYPDRFRIRYPSKEEEYTLNAHLDSGAIERWEDPLYRTCYQACFDGEWENYDAWAADHRLDAKTDLYQAGANCSCWRSMQGWLSMSHTNTGEGTLRLLPSLKASTAYMMLRPLFTNGTDEFDEVTPTFPGATPGNTQFFPTRDFHPHLAMEKSIVGIPPVRPGDYVFWHSDLIHEVDRFNPGVNDSSVAYNACTPLTPYNISSLLDSRKAFLAARPPRDFKNLGEQEAEYEHADHGARMENILSLEGRRAMGFEKFDEDEGGITEGQREMRKLANIR